MVFKCTRFGLEPPNAGLVKMDKSIFKRNRFKLDNQKHKYISGSQHSLKKADNELYSAAHETLVFFLQNKSGSEKWPASDEFG